MISIPNWQCDKDTNLDGELPHSESERLLRELLDATSDVRNNGSITYMNPQDRIELRRRLCESEYLRLSLRTTRHLRGRVSGLQRLVKLKDGDVHKLKDELADVRRALEQVSDLVRDYVLDAPAKVL
jgi:hypothetical protein